MKFASPSCVCFISFGFLLATICVWVWMVCSLHSVTTGSRDRANVSLIIVGTSNMKQVFSVLKDYTEKRSTLYCESALLLQLK